MPVEREFKLRGDGIVDAAQVDDALREAGMEYRIESPVDQEDRYLDDSRFSLARSGLGLRLRTRQGAVRLELKAAGSREGDLWIRKEIEQPWSRPAPPTVAAELPQPMRDLVEPQTYDRPLGVVLTLSTHRERRVFGADGEATAELVIDRVEASRGEASRTTFGEVEIEIAGRDPGPFAAVARLLGERLELTPATDNKLVHGMARLGLSAPAPDGAELRADLPLDRTAWIVLSRHFRRMQRREPGTRRGEDIEELHKMRVTCRRMRAALRAFGDALPPNDAAFATEVLRETGRALGPVRDLDVMLEDLPKVRALLPSDLDAATEAVHRLLLKERQRAQERLRVWLSQPDRLTAAARLQELLEQAPRPAEPAPETGVAAVERIARSSRRVRKRGRAVGPDSPVADLHELRIAFKKLRYLLENLGDLYGDGLSRWVQRTVEFQDLLGLINDHHTFAARLSHLARAPGVELPPASWMAVGAMVTVHERQVDTLRRRFKAAWKDLDGGRWKKLARQAARPRS